MKKPILIRLFTCVLFFLCSAPLLAQQGNYFLSHYAPSDKQFDNVCFDMLQDEQGVMLFATKAGVLEFDGQNWEWKKDMGAVYSLCSGNSGEIFWGGANGFGILGSYKNGLQNQRLSNNETKDIFQSLVIKDQAYFLNNKTLFVYSLSSKKITEIKSTDFSGSFSGLFELFGQAYVNTERGDKLRVEASKLIKSNLSVDKREEIIFSEELDNNYLLGTADGRLYQCGKDLKFHEIILVDKEYAKAGVIVSGNWVNKKLIALGTLRGGVMFINTVTGKTEEIINYNTGLPDNEVFAVMCDKNRNVWVAHDYGFTRIAPYLPLRSFSYYSGLQGNLLCVISFQNKIYVGTSLGLFKLEREELYDEISYYTNVEIKKNSKNEKTKVVTPEEEIKTAPIEEPESKKKGFFSFLKRNKRKEPVTTKPKTDEKKEQQKAEDVEESAEPHYVKEKRVQRILRASNFTYKKVKGIDAKVTQLIEIEGRLFAAGLAGIHEVTGLGAQPLLREPVRFAFANKQFFLVATYEDKVKSWSLSDEDWEKTFLLDDIDDDINFIFEGGKNEIWLCSRTQVYRLEIEDGKIIKINTLDLPIANFDHSVGINWKGNTIIVNAEGFFNYDRKKDILVKLDTLAKPATYFAWTNTIWYHDLHGWKSLGASADQSNLQLLNLFQDLRFITSDQYHDNLWLITGGNELFKFFGERLHPHESIYPLIIKSVRNGETNISYRSKIRIDELQSSLLVEVVQPDYIGSQAIEYRYFLKGLHNDWSEWSTVNRIVDFPYLPPGKYALSMQARNIFGETREMQPLAFIVQAPYWQRPWFYALEFSVFALLVLLSFRLSTRYIIVSRILSLLTIILLIQFIQTVASASIFSKPSPVLDFFVQVVVALLILPVEGYMRRLLLRSHDMSTDIGQLIKLQAKNIKKRKKEN